VEAIDTQANEVTIKSSGDATVRLKLTNDTQILIGGKAGDLSNIAVGDLVKVRYDSEASVAAEIRVQTEAEAHGTVRSVDTAKGQLVIALDNGAILTLKLTPNTGIEVNHKKAAAADLKTNASVEVEYNIKAMEAREVEASTKAGVRGTVRTVNPTSGTVTIRTDEGKEIALKVTNSTKVDIQGLLFGILGISPGMTVKAEFDLTNGEAVALKASAEARGEGRERAESKAHGTIASTDSAGGKVTVNLDGGGTLAVSTNGDTQIELNGQRAAAANLQAGARVKIEYNVETLIASDIGAKSKPQVHLEAEAHGTVQLLDAAKHVMTIRLRDGSTKELALEATTVIRINGRSSAAVDLKPGMEIEVRYLTDTGAVLRINTTSKVETQAEVRGKVKSVDVVARQLVVETAGGKSVVVSLGASTVITRGALPITLVDIAIGTEVKIRLKVGVSENVAESVEVLGRPGASLRQDLDITLDTGGSGQGPAAGSASTEGESKAGGSSQGPAAGGASAEGESRAGGSGQGTAAGGPRAEGEFEVGVKGTIQVP
jgi:hypothetical protein